MGFFFKVYRYDRFRIFTTLLEDEAKRFEIDLALTPQFLQEFIDVEGQLEFIEDDLDDRLLLNVATPIGVASHRHECINC